MSDKLIIKLINNIEVIGQVNEINTHGIILTYPMQINYRYYLSALPNVSLVGYAMFAKEQNIMFSFTNILHQYKPKEAFIKFYSHTVEQYKERIEKSIDIDLEAASKTHDEKQQSYLKELLESMPTDKASIN